MAIAPVNAASSTSSNWLKEAQDSLVASETPGGMMGALQDARYSAGSIKTFLAKSQNTMYSLSLIAQNSQASAGALYAQMANTAAQKLADERAALAAKLNPTQTNFNPPAQLDPVIYFTMARISTPAPTSGPKRTAPRSTPPPASSTSIPKRSSAWRTAPISTPRTTS